MSRATAPPSLLDDPSFVAELATLELPSPTTEVWGGIRWQREPPVAEASDDGEMFEDAEETGILKPGVPVGRTLLTVGGFVVMMLVGAAAAVVVFHDRVMHILQLLQ